jgi:hypothetical protein
MGVFLRNPTALTDAPLANDRPRRAGGLQGPGASARWASGHPGPRHRDEQGGQHEGAGEE